MKKLITLAVLLFAATFAKAQVDGYYVSPGVGYSNHVVSYGAEVGLYKGRFWLSALVSTSKDEGSSHYSTFAGLKPYFKIVSAGKVADVYVFEGVYAGCFKPFVLEVEPGLALVHNITDTFALQLSGSVPLYTLNSYETKPAVSLGVNFYFQ